MNKSWHNNDNIMNSEAVSQPAPLYRRILWSMPFRVLFGLGVPAAALAGLWFLYRFGNPFPCVFHKLTGAVLSRLRGGAGAVRAAASASGGRHRLQCVFCHGAALGRVLFAEEIHCPGFSPRSAADIQHLPAHLQYRDAGDSRLLDSAQHPRVSLYAVGPMRVDID